MDDTPTGVMPASLFVAILTDRDIQSAHYRPNIRALYLWLAREHSTALRNHLGLLYKERLTKITRDLKPYLSQPDAILWDPQPVPSDAVLQRWGTNALAPLVKQCAIRVPNPQSPEFLEHFCTTLNLFGPPASPYSNGLVTHQNRITPDIINIDRLQTDLLQSLVRNATKQGQPNAEFAKYIHQLYATWKHTGEADFCMHLAHNLESSGKLVKTPHASLLTSVWEPNAAHYKLSHHELMYLYSTVPEIAALASTNISE